MALGPLLTDAGTALLAVYPLGRYTSCKTEIVEIDGNGDPRMRCELPLALRVSEVLLDELLVASEVSENPSGSLRYSVQAVRLPGIRLAPHGWVGRTGRLASAAQPVNGP